MSYRIKYLIVLVARIAFRIVYLFLPVKRNRVLFCSFNGMQYTCNPKYIFERLYRRYGRQYDYVWVLDNRENLPDEFKHSVTVVKFRSIKYIYHLIRSETIINNIGFESILPKRKKQLFINTWHGGGAYKRVSSDMNMYPEDFKRYTQQVHALTEKTTDYFLSSSQTFTEITSRDFGIDKSRFIPTGMPRNDRFFSPDNEKSRRLKEEICKRYRIAPDTLLVLYAPTFRDYGKKMRNIGNRVCCPTVEHALTKAFHRKVTFLYRRHISKYDTATHFRNGDTDIVDLTHYPDMQDLLEIADILITDYSSSIWDFSFTGKPGFLYMPDLAEYRYDRGFYTPLDKWPFPYAETIDELCELFASYTAEENNKRTTAHQRRLGSYERGKATDGIIDIIVGRTR